MHFINLKTFYSKNDLEIDQRGFGLLELLVSISIIALVSAVVLVRNNAFNGAVLLRDQAYEVAFALKQAQLMAVSGTDVAGATSHQFGILFDTSTGNNQQYLTFRDDGKLSGRYDNDGIPPDDVQIGLMGHLDKRFKIWKITDSSSPATTPIMVNVSFKRPNFDAIFINGAGHSLTGPVFIDIAAATKASNDLDTSVGQVRRIKITSTGQISVVTY